MDALLGFVVGGISAVFLALGVVFKIAFAIIGIAIWCVYRYVMQKALQNAGVRIGGVLFVPVLGDVVMISLISKGEKLPFFSLRVSPILSQAFVVLSFVSTCFFPGFLKIFVTVLGFVCNGAVYTRIWDLADDREYGHNSLWGLASAVFGIILFVKYLIMAFSSNGIRSAQPVQPLGQQDQFNSNLSSYAYVRYGE